jgi:hypothetical protein
MQIRQPARRREGLCIAGGRAEPLVRASDLDRALAKDDIERLRPLLPVGYAAGIDAYRTAAAALEPSDLSEHYTRGLAAFHEEFVPHLARRLEALAGGAWDLSGFVAYAAGSDVDLMSHIVEAVAPREGVAVYPGDWWGFVVGSTHPERIAWSDDARGKLAACCVPSVRNGHFTDEMLAFLETSDACLLNINLFPTLAPDERRRTAEALSPILPRALLSVSFSRGFGLTASQLGVLLVPREHPYRARFDAQWTWHTYFYNALAARAFLAIDLERLAAVDDARRAWAREWLAARGLPALESGSYYVRTFTVDGAIPERLAPLHRAGRVRLCLKPPIV